MSYRKILQVTAVSTNPDGSVLLHTKSGYYLIQRIDNGLSSALHVPEYRAELALENKDNLMHQASASDLGDLGPGENLAF